jgi:hypothetical protein
MQNGGMWAYAASSTVANLAKLKCCNYKWVHFGAEWKDTAMKAI